MCGRFAQKKPKDLDIQARFDLNQLIIDLLNRYNLTPSMNIPVVYRQNEATILDTMKWGLVPSWAKEEKIGYKMINARAETLTEKPAFKSLLQKSRCLIPASGFYEWQKIDKDKKNGKKIPYSITLRDEPLFAFAGLWNVWKSQNGVANEVLKTFTIITCEANSLLIKIHDRMPVILDGKAAEQRWLNPNLPFDEVKDLLAPFPDERMMHEEIERVDDNAPILLRTMTKDDAPAELF